MSSPEAFDWPAVRPPALGQHLEALGWSLELWEVWKGGGGGDGDGWGRHWPGADHRARAGYEGQAPGSALPGRRVIGNLWAQGLRDFLREMAQCQLLLLKSVIFCIPEVSRRTETAGVVELGQAQASAVTPRRGLCGV